MGKHSLIILIIIISGVISQGCNEPQQMGEMPVYEGPTVELNNVLTYYSDSAVVRLKLMADKELEYENQDQEFPEGIYLEFYDKDGNMTTTLTANYCYHYQDKGKWRALRNVVVDHIINNEELHTEELYWDPQEETIMTNKFVVIQTQDEILMGEGLEANQDFSWWRILHGRGTITLDEQPQ